MIFNLLYWLVQRFPSFSFSVEGHLTGDPQERVDIKLVPGAVRTYPDNRSDDQVQITVYGQDQYETRQRADAIFSAMRELYEITLEPHPDQGTDGRAYIVSRMAALSRPIPAGRDTDGCFIYRSNYVLTYSG